MRLAVDLHTHTVASTAGGLTELDLISAAVGAGLDVLGITEHDSTLEGPVVRPAQVTAAGTGSPRPLVVRGREFTAGPGHRVVLDGGPVIVAHPFAPYAGGSAIGPPARDELLEVWNGRWRSDRPWQADNEAALGWWAELLAAARPHEMLPVAVGNSDTHLAGQMGTPCTVADVDGRSVTAALAAVSSGRSWIVAGAHIVVELVVRRKRVTAGPGQVLVGPGPVTAAVTAAGAGGCHVTLLDREGVLEVGRLERDGTLEWTVDPAALLRVEIRDQVGDMLALSNPVRIIGDGHDGSSAPGNDLGAGRLGMVPTARWGELATGSLRRCGRTPCRPPCTAGKGSSSPRRRAMTADVVRVAVQQQICAVERDDLRAASHRRDTPVI